MSSPLSSYKDHTLTDVISRRIKSKTYGLGFWSAVEAAGTKGEHVKDQLRLNPLKVKWDGRQ